MAKVLTHANTVTCTHNDAPVSLAGQTKLRVATKPVLVESSLKGRVITGCLNNQGGNTPCTAVDSVTGRFAAKLRFGTAPVLLEALTGETNGTVKPLIASDVPMKLIAQ